MRIFASELKLDKSENTTGYNGCLRQLLGLICSRQQASVFGDLTENGFSKDICRSMIATMDQDRSGKLGYAEFQTLWLLLKNWKNAWILYDIDRSGSFSGFELRQAMESAGYLLNNRVLNALMHRYGGKNGEIRFDDFMMCAIKIRTMIDVFKAKDQAGSGTASFTFEEWMENTLYA